MTSVSLGRRLLAEGLGTAILVAAVVGSGIMGESLAGGNVALALLANTAATAGVLFALIATLGPVSGAHFNPLVTLADAWFGGTPRRDVVPYIVVQIVGACVGAILANLMFGLAAITVSTHERTGAGIWLSEAVAALGLLLVIFGLVRSGRSTWVAAAVACYIAGAYWFTASTSFANPAVTIGRSLSDTFTGIAPASVPAFIVAQFIGAVVAVVLVTALWPHPADRETAAAIDIQPEDR
ncbi:MAG: aquaporin family protein [Actinobacteria bacterium]|nr:aquaporin family protein [Actinomycetota bacterium]